MALACGTNLCARFLDPKLLDELATGRYLAEGRNVILLDPPGVGKMHLAIWPGCLRGAGEPGYFTSAVELTRKLSLAPSTPATIPAVDWNDSPRP